MYKILDVIGPLEGGGWGGGGSQKFNFENVCAQQRTPAAIELNFFRTAGISVLHTAFQVKFVKWD